MKILTLAFLSLTMALPAAAAGSSKAPVCPPIRADHPRIMFNADSWPVVKARAEGPSRKYLDELLKACDGMTDNPVCTGVEAIKRQAGRQADGTYVSKSGTSYPPIKEFGKEAAQCALAWRFTGNDKYLEKGYRMLKASVEGYVAATGNRRPVDWYSTGRINALCAYDWMYEGLTQEQRAAVIVPLVEHVRLVQSESGLDIPRQPDGSKKTGFYGMKGLLWYAGLAAAGDGFCDKEASEMLQRGYELFIEVIEHRNSTAGDDGALISGAINYAWGNYPFAHFNFFRSLESATGKNITSEYPAMAYFPYWIWWTWIRDSEKPGGIRHAGLADSYHADNLMANQFGYEHLSNYISCFRETNPEATSFNAAFREWMTGKTISTKFPATPFLVDLDCPVDGEMSSKLEKPGLKARHFETLGQFIMRSGWTPSDTYCSFVAGATVTQHKHYDENSFTIYKYDHLALDTGDRGAQNDLNLAYYFAQTVAHNAVLIQKPGERLPRYWGPKSDDDRDNFNYGGQVNHKPATVCAFETNDKYSYIASDATVCYGPKAKSCVRQFVYLYPDYFVIYDRVDSEQPEYEKDWLLHFKNEPVIKGNLLRADSDSGRFFCQTFLPANARIDVIGGRGREFRIRNKDFPIAPKTVNRNLETARKRGRGPYTGAWRTELKAKKEKSEMRFLNVITVGGTDMQKPVPAKYVNSATQDGVILTIDGQKVAVSFNRSGEIGGNISFGADAAPLTGQVQPQAGIIL